MPPGPVFLTTSSDCKGLGISDVGLLSGGFRSLYKGSFKGIHKGSYLRDPLRDPLREPVWGLGLRGFPKIRGTLVWGPYKKDPPI